MVEVHISLCTLLLIPFNSAAASFLAFDLSFSFLPFSSVFQRSIKSLFKLMRRLLG